MNERIQTRNGLPQSDTLRSILDSLAKIEAGEINSNDMLARMLLIDGSPAWRQKNISSLLEEAKQEICDPDVELTVDNSIYLHIAKKALEEATAGSEVGLWNAQDSLEKAFSLAKGSLKGKDIQDLSAMLPSQLLRLAK